MIQAESPQPTRTSSGLCLSGLEEAPFVPVRRIEVIGASSSASRVSRSIQSTRAFHTPAISSQPGRVGRSIWLTRFHSRFDSPDSSLRLDLIILMPASLTHTTYLPDKDHLMVLMIPSPLCKILSVPVFAPSPIDPSQLEAAAAAPVVVALALFPVWPPTVSTNEPA